MSASKRIGQRGLRSWANESLMNWYRNCLYGVFLKWIAFRVSGFGHRGWLTSFEMAVTSNWWGSATFCITRLIYCRWADGNGMFLEIRILSYSSLWIFSSCLMLEIAEIGKTLPPSSLNFISRFKHLKYSLIFN